MAIEVKARRVDLRARCERRERDRMLMRSRRTWAGLIREVQQWCVDQGVLGK